MDRKKDIILKARKQFTRYGYTKTTMADIARECEITKPTLYHYYSGKADIFAAVVTHEQNAFFDLVGQAVAGVASSAEKLRIYADMQIKTLREFFLLGDLSRHAFLDLHPEAVKILTACRRRDEELLGRWIGEGIRCGEFAGLDSGQAARVFFITLAALKFDGLVLNNPTADEIMGEQAIVESLAEEFHRFVDLFLNGLRMRGENL